MKRTISSIWSPVVVAGAVVLASAVGLVAGDSPNGSILERWTSAQQAAGSFRMSMVSDTEAGGFSVGFNMDGLFDAASEHSSMEMRTGGFEGEAVCRFVASWTEVFVEIPEEARGAHAGNRWLRVPVGDFPVGEGAGSLTVGGLDPRFFRDLEPAGTESVRGTPTTRYRGVLELRAAAEEFRAAAEEFSDPRARQSLEMSRFPDEIPVDVWVDSENLARRIQYRFEVNAEGGSFSTTVTMESYDYGTADTVTPPDEGEVGDGGPEAFNVCFGA